MRLFVNAAGQQTSANPITAGQTTIVLPSTSVFPSPTAYQQFSVVILDAGNPSWNANNPLSTPYEYAVVTNNNTGTNTLTWTRGQAGTSAHAFVTGAIVAAVPLSQDLDASFRRHITTVTAPGATSSVTLPTSGSLASLGITAFPVLRILYQAQGSAIASLQIQFNADTAAHYFSNAADIGSAVNATSEQGIPAGVTAGTCGQLASTASVNTGVGEITIFGADQTTFRVQWTYLSWRIDGASSGNTHTQHGGGLWVPTSLAAITSITLLASTGTIVSGSRFILSGEPG